MEIGDVSLLAGVTMSPPIYLMHLSPEIYTDLEPFWPELFLEDRAGT
ncbi:cytochrome P450 [Mycobacterium uberis]|nr:cytochrome P450 [Mycobacterium uberis]